MVDEEPGGVTRLGLFQNVFSRNSIDWDTIVSDVTRVADLGIDVILSPIADFPYNNNSFIRKRTAFRSEEDLIDFNARFLALLRSHRVAGTLKHFPGMGVFIEDPHQVLPRSGL